MSPVGHDAQGREIELPIAAADTVVRDPLTGVDRQIIAGTAVPLDLLDAYQAHLDGDANDGGGEPAGAYHGVKKADLEKEVASRQEAGRTIEVEGTGQNGNVTAPDLLRALEADDAAGKD